MILSLRSGWWRLLAGFAVVALLWGTAGASAARAQAAPDALGAVKNALRNGSAKETAALFGPTVELGVDGNKQSYSQTQAEFVVRDFFAKNPPVSFEFVHEGASDAGTPYAIGRYATKTAAYRVFIKLKAQKTGLLIDNLDFTKE